jgi:D-alanyl-D-alanine carboxypeptidase/D-alanyl-D-alanine-endopeptidase (penicillin-binding protein 4)
MKKLRLLLFLILVNAGFTANSQDKITATLSQGAYKYSSFSIYAVEAESGNILYESPTKSLSPASTMKLVTTAVALDLLGADFRFETNLTYDGEINKEQKLLLGNLIIEGGCDPAFYSSYFVEEYKNTFENWAVAIKNLGINKVEGDLVIDLSALDRSAIPGGWIWEDIGNYYGAGVSALSYSDNLYKIHFRSPDESGKPVDISFLEPDIKNLQLENRVTSSDIESDKTIVYGSPGSFQQVVEGTIPKGRRDFVVKASMPDPALVAAEKFRNTLRNNEISVTGEIKILYQSLKENRIQINSKKSPPLSELIVPLNQESVNLFAEHLLREIGRKTNNDPSLPSGIDAVAEFFKEKKVFAEGFYQVDGSGLSRGNAITTRTLVEILKCMYVSNYREQYFNSLPASGQQGTLKNSFKGTVLENNLRAKTGSMERVRSIAGTLKSKNGKTVIFAIIINNFNPSPGVTNGILETILTEFYNESNQNRSK